VIAASSPFDAAEFARGIERLRSRYEVSFDPAISSRSRGFLAGSDEVRLMELLRAIEDPSVDAIVAARGGYGSMRILDVLEPAQIAARPKLLCGFSDVTAIHALWARARVRSLHAAMVCGLGRASDAAASRWISAAESTSPLPPLAGLESVGARGVAEGTLLGGNLALLAATIGTPLFPPLENAILFVEDVGEAPYRIDRMVTQLLLSGVLEGVQGVVLGAFTRCEPGADGTTAGDVLRERFGGLQIPVLAGAPAGHVEDPIEIPLGVRARIDADRRAVTFLEAVLAPM
jgi:muramoyltetrapeptide carboxypeptidase